MNKIFLTALMVSILFISPAYAVIHGDLSGNTNLSILNMGDTVDNMKNSSSITTMNNGAIVGMKDDSFITKMDGGFISGMFNESYITKMNYGSITTMKDNSHIVENNGGNISTIYNTSHIDTMTGGRITNMKDQTYVTTMNKGTITKMHDTSHVDTMTGNSTINEMITGSYVTNLDGGTIKVMKNNTYVDKMNGGTIQTMNNISHVNKMTNGTINNMKDTSYVTTLDGGTIKNMENNTYVTTMEKGNINNMKDTSHVDIMKDGTIGTMENDTVVTTMEKGNINNMKDIAHVDTMKDGTIGTMDDNSYITNMTNGTITEMKGTSYVDTMDNGTITDMKGSAFVTTMKDGAIGTMDDNSYITNMTNGTITEMKGTSYVDTMDNGTITDMKGSAFVTTMKDGTIGTMDDNSYIINMTTGTITEMKGTSYVDIMDNGTITDMKGSAFVTTMKDGAIGTMDDNSYITNMITGTITEMKGTSYVDTMDNGTITDMKGSAFVTTMKDGAIGTMDDNSYITNMTNGTITEMSGSSHVDTMDNGTITHMKGSSFITTMNGGLVNDISRAKITSVNLGTIDGNVSVGSSIGVNNNGNLYLNASTSGKSFAGIVNTLNNATVKVKDYTLAGRSQFNMGNNSTLVIDSVVAPDVRFLGDGVLKVTSYTPGTYANAKINNLITNGTVTFEFDVDEAIGGGNDQLTIVNSPNFSEKNHLVSVGSSHVSSDNREPIDLIKDDSGSLNFNLTSGQYVGLGAKNYELLSTAAGTGNQWSLFLLKNSLSDNALVVGTIASANLMSAYSIDASLHQRMGDIRAQKKAGLWARTYTNQMKFKYAASAEVKNYATEAGADKHVANLGNGRLFTGVSLGLNYADDNVRTYNSRDGGARSTMPYLAAYTTWSNCDGFYLDAVARYIYNDTNGYYYDGANKKQSFNVNSHILGSSLELGYQYKLSNKFTLEPRAQLSYTYLMNDSFMDDAGYRGKYGNTNSLLGTIGMIARYNIEKSQYYIKLSAINEFDGKSDITYDNTRYKSDIGGVRGEVGVGTIIAFRDNINIFAETVYEAGENSFRNYSANIGLHARF